GDGVACIHVGTGGSTMNIRLHANATTTPKIRRFI
ncbi:MAG: Mobile element protein, partial [Olavius algarvensis Gamma 1 endosymbiont]